METMCFSWVFLKTLSGLHVKIRNRKVDHTKGLLTLWKFEALDNGHKE